MDRQEVLADDVEPRGRQQVVDIGYPARDRILDRDHGEFRLPFLHRREGVLEGRARQGLIIRVDLLGRRCGNSPPVRPETRSACS